MNERTVSVNGRDVPRMIYGTAWKEDETERLTLQAIEAGFRGIDTANQRKHYNEEAVGQAVRSAIASGIVTRNELFLQTKFTYRDGQDKRLPYDPTASIAAQVEQSLASSLSHFGVEVVDSLLLHGPSQRNGLGQPDWDAWRAMERLHGEGRVRAVGVSNITLGQLEALSMSARVAPQFVQNRCYATRGWDREVRRFCDENGVIYQGFSLLTANQATLGLPSITEAAERHGCTVAQLVFRFAMDVGMTVLTGTSDEQHMLEDLRAFDIQLSADEVARIECLAG